jgi:hypothetical protein
MSACFFAAPANDLPFGIASVMYFAEDEFCRPARLGVTAKIFLIAG